MSYTCHVIYLTYHAYTLFPKSIKVYPLGLVVNNNVLVQTLTKQKKKKKLSEKLQFTIFGSNKNTKSRCNTLFIELCLSTELRIVDRKAGPSSRVWNGLEVEWKMGCSQPV